jgi:hypothetical protein
VTTLAGNGSKKNEDGPATSAMFAGMAHVVLDALGNAYVVDVFSRVRKVSSSGFVSTLAGNDTIASIDGIGTSACFAEPRGICFDANESAVFITHNHILSSCIRRIALASGGVTTIAGRCNESGFVDGIGVEARFSTTVWCITGSSQDVLYAWDDKNSALRVIS